MKNQVIETGLSLADVNTDIEDLILNGSIVYLSAVHVLPQTCMSIHLYVDKYYFNLRKMTGVTTSKKHGAQYSHNITAPLYICVFVHFMSICVKHLVRVIYLL